MAGIPLNPDVPLTTKTPDTYLYISTSPTTSGTPQPKNLFLLAPFIDTLSGICGSPYLLTAGTAQPNSIEQYTSQSTVNSSFNRRSIAARRYAAATQAQPIGINVFSAAVSEPTGTGFSGFATALLTFAGTASGSGQIKVRVCGRQFLVSVANGDTGATIAATALTAMGGVGGGSQSQQPDCPMVPGTVSSGTLPLIATNRGATGNDRPIVVEVPPEITGITVSPGTITIATNAAGASGGASLFTIRCGSQAVTVSIPATTTPANAAIAIAAAINAATFGLKATASSSTVTLLYRNGWVVQRVQVNSTEDAGGQTYTLNDRHDGCQPLITCTGNATGTTLTLTAGSSSVSITINAANTPAQSATAIQTAVNAAAGFPLDANAPVGGAVQLVWTSGQTPLIVSLSGTDATQTYALTYPLAITSAATTAGSAAYTGLSGSGVPTLTTVLANKAKMVPMMEWFTEFVDSTSLGAISTHVEQYANGYYQANQRVTFASSAVLDVASSVTGITAANDILGGPSPALTNYWRYEEIVEQDTVSMIGSFAAELAADLCAAQLPFNYDGHYLAQGTQEPIIPGRPDTELDPNTVDTAMRSYFLTVAQNDNGRVKIVRGVTSWSFTNTEWADFSYGRMFDDARYRLREFLNQRFGGKVLFTATSPRVDNAFTLKDVEDAVREWLLSRDGITVDGAQTLGRFVTAEVDPDDGSFIRLAFRLRVPREAHVKSGVISSAPAAS